MDNIDKYYLISRFSNNDIEIVAKIIEIFQTPPKMQTMRDIEGLNLSRYSETLEKLMDLKVSTIKDISKCFGTGA